jgi:hypothetical protein
VPVYEPGTNGAPLAVLALGVVGDDRPLPELQPVLPEGIHLRWSISPERGFPWYGFYLLRRPTLTSGVATCLSTELQSSGRTPGDLGTNVVGLLIGVFRSDQNLILSDDFPASGTVELDLSGRSYLDFQALATNPSRQVDVEIGFIEDFPPPGGGGPGDPGDPGGPDPGGPGGSGGPGDPGGPGGDPGAGPKPDDGLGTDTSSAGCGCACGVTNGGIRPLLERVIALGNGSYRAIFGYFNPSAQIVSLPLGAQNQFVPNPALRGQPTQFYPGLHRNVFSVTFSGRPIAWSLGGVVTSASSALAVLPTSADGIVVTAFRSGFPVAYRLVTGRAGEVVRVSLAFEAIDSVRISSGPARLIDLCTTPVSDGAGDGWEPAPGFPQPMTLPVRHDQYPPRAGTPDRDESEAFALARVRYGEPSIWAGEPFSALHAALIEIVQGGPSSGITEFEELTRAEPDPSDPDAVLPEIEESSLGAILMASLQPAIAQMLGLYWIDEATVEGQSYDYLLVADYTNAGGGDVETIRALATAEDFSAIDAYRRIGVPYAAAPRLSPPGEPQAFALPVAAVTPPTPGDAAGLVGLRWQIAGQDDVGRLALDSALAYHVWRKDFGRTQLPGPVPDGEYLRVTALPVTPGEMRLEDPPQPLRGWPSFGLFAVNGPLLEGWYGFRVSGIDIFGRHSERSAPAPWVDVTDTTLVHNTSAVHLLDTRPPPPPNQVQAWLLDPADPFVIQDAAYLAWRDAAPPGTIGLRLRWVWNGRQMLQAPDTREFRVYLSAGSSLVDASTPASWPQRIAVVGFAELLLGEGIEPGSADDGALLQGSSVSVAGDVVTLGDAGTLPGGDGRLRGVADPALEIELRTSTGTIVRASVLEVDAASAQLRVAPAPPSASYTSWAVGIRERTYELFLPGASLAIPPAYSLPFAPSLGAPIVYGLVGVSAADDKSNELALDTRLTGPLAGRPGNEGPVGGPATVFHVLRELPGAPDSPFTEERLFATRADFDSRSFFNLHWSKSSVLATHVYRALDQTLFQVDAAKGFGAGAREADLASGSVFPSGWDDARRNAAAAQLRALTSLASYDTLSDSALRVLASFPSNAAAFSRLTAEPLPSTTPDLRGASDPASYMGADSLGSYLDTLDGRAQNRYFYRTAYEDGAHNAGPLGLSTPPVYLPPVVLPDAPVLRSATANDGETSISLVWASSRSPAVVGYRVFRTDEPARGRDIRLMQELTSIAEVPLAARPPTHSFKDESVRGLTTYVYRVVAFDEEGKASGASLPAQARAVDDALPSVPALSAEWTTVNSVTLAELSWNSADETLLQERRADRTQWLNLGTWRPAGEHSLRDPLSRPTADFSYRLVVRKYTGAIARGQAVTLAKQ